MAARYIEGLGARQPTGAYHLGGSSLGGLVAYEMAQQRRAQGQETALLALLDTPGPSQMPVRPQDEAEMLVDLLGNWLPLSVEELRGLGPDERLLHLVTVARAQGELPEDFGIADARRHLLVVEALWKGMFAYQPQPYPGRVFFVRAVERGPTDPLYPELVWIGLAQAGTEVRVVPGGHTTMHYPPYVEELGLRLRTGLRGGSPRSS